MKEGTLIDIRSKGEYPSCALSNFAAHTFVVDGVKCSSMEGFLQSLKFRNPEKQKRICRLFGKAAKNASRHSIAQIRWRLTQTLYWQGRRIGRNSAAYQQLLDRAYAELGRNEDFLAALKATGNCELVHSVGEHHTKKTVLTEYEFISRLKRIRQTIET